MKQTVLEIRNLAIDFRTRGRTIHALRGLDLEIRKGEIHALVGESGSGKSVASRAVLGLTPVPPGDIVSGEILYREQDLLKLDENELNRIRGSRISMIFQEPARYLNPVLNVGEQIGEQLRFHRGAGRREAAGKALDLLEEVELGRDAKLLKAYPHELSGGMKQRVMIAVALACDPEILLADEPTTALDVTVQDRILTLLLKLRDRYNLSILFVSHDLAVVQSIADRVSVIYAGRIRESADTADLFTTPGHPYTTGLLGSVPDPCRRGKELRVIPGTVLDPREEPAGCAFAPRCPLADRRCRENRPESETFPASDTAGFRRVRCFHTPLKSRGGPV